MQCNHGGCTRPAVGGRKYCRQCLNAANRRARAYYQKKLAGLVAPQQRPRDPTPEEIAQRAAEIRANWSEQRKLMEERQPRLYRLYDRAYDRGRVNGQPLAPMLGH